MDVPASPPFSIINRGRQLYPTIGARAKYLSIQWWHNTEVEVDISRNPASGGGSPGRRLTADNPLFELSDFTNGSVPLDWWVSAAGGVGGNIVFVTIIDDVQ